MTRVSQTHKNERRSAVHKVKLDLVRSMDACTKQYDHHKRTTTTTNAKEQSFRSSFFEVDLPVEICDLDIRLGETTAVRGVMAVVRHSRALVRVLVVRGSGTIFYARHLGNGVPTLTADVEFVPA